MVWCVKKTTTYREARSYDNERRRFLKELYKSRMMGRDIVFIDQTGFITQPFRGHGRAPKGARVYSERTGKREKRTSLIGGYRNGKLVAPMTYRGTCNTAFFNAWLETLLLPVLKPGSVIVLDNATIHKSRRSAELAEGAGCRLLFLPPYAPELNPIEKLWANIKRAWAYREEISLEEFLAAEDHAWG